jgi:hypothetical protein
MSNPIKEAVEKLRAAGREVERADDFPPPLPGLYFVDGVELTERQLLQVASDLEKGE